MGAKAHYGLLCFVLAVPDSQVCLAAAQWPALRVLVADALDLIARVAPLVRARRIVFLLRQ